MIEPRSHSSRFGTAAALVGLLGVAGLLVLLGVGALLHDAPAGVAPSAAESAATPTVVTSEELPAELRHGMVGQGGTLAGALDRLGLAPAERQAVLEKVGEHLDLRRLSPATGLVVALDAEGRIRHVSVRGEADRFVRVTLGDDGAPGAELITLPVTTSTETTGGVVESSVAQALSACAHAAQLTQAFADIFQWDVDLLVDPRPGDTVRLVFEVLRLGEVPHGLPGFGDAADRPGQFLRLGRILAASYEGRLASASAYWVDDGESGGDYYDNEGLPLRKSFLKSPLRYRRISSGFSRSRRHPVTRKVVPHHGVDFAAAPGTPVVATADGRVSAARWDGALGRAVRIRHGSEYVTVYGHLRRFAKGVRSGVEVRQSQVVGYVGSTGRATGPHLHYSVLRYGRPINPLRMENPPVEPLPASLRPRLEESKLKWTPVLAAIRPAGNELQVASGPRGGDAQADVRPGL